MARNTGTVFEIDAPATKNGRPMSGTVTFKQALVKGGDRQEYQAHVRFMSHEALLEQGLRNVVSELRTVVADGDFPADRVPEVVVTQEGVQVQETFEDVVEKLSRMSEEEKKAMQEQLAEKLRAIQAAMAVK